MSHLFGSNSNSRVVAPGGGLGLQVGLVLGRALGLRSSESCHVLCDQAALPSIQHHEKISRLQPHVLVDVRLCEAFVAAAELFDQGISHGHGFLPAKT